MRRGSVADSSCLLDPALRNVLLANGANPLAALSYDREHRHLYGGDLHSVT